MAQEAETTDPVEETGEETIETEADEKPPWGDDFDAERAWKLTQNLREEAKAAKKDAAAAREKVKEFEDKDKSEAQRLQDRAETAEKSLAAAERLVLVSEVALEKGLTPAQAKRLIGTTKEELEADADELLASFKQETGGQELTGRPRERLRPGAVPAAEAEETDPEKLAALVPRRYGGR